MYIVDEAGFDAALTVLKNASVLAIDTEFMRERTYFARLCLVQIATLDEVFLFDPMVADIPLERLAPLLVDPSVMKVFHAGSQDIEILFRATGVVSSPVFDTQIAATLAGFPAQVGYAQLVHDLLGISIDKADTFTDWSARPLTVGQREYAAEDVRHLPPVYEALREELEDRGRLEWLADDFLRLTDPAVYTVDPYEQYRRVKRANTLNRRGLAVLREIAAWREIEAQKSDLPKRWVISDESLVEIARRKPQDAKTLGAIRGVSGKVAARRSADIVQAIAYGMAVPEGELPQLPKKKRMSAEVHAIADLLSAVVRMRARQHGVASSLLASRDELERFAAGDWDSSALVSGWRYTLVGAELQDVLSGRICAGVQNGRVTVGMPLSGFSVPEESTADDSGAGMSKDVRELDDESR